MSGSSTAIERFSNSYTSTQTSTSKPEAFGVSGFGVLGLRVVGLGLGVQDF